MAMLEARPFLFIWGLLILGALFIWVWLALIPVFLFVFTLYFFRDPEREIPQDEHAIVSAADGKVIRVDEVEESWFNRKKMKRVAVFLSVLDVHVNRSPVQGEIIEIQHENGAFYDAREQRVETDNENQRWWIRSKKGDVVVRQIAGLIARRIVAWRDCGHSMEKGERMGMIRFGSRTDVYIPLHCHVVVKPGDLVKAGSSIIAHWPQK